MILKKKFFTRMKERRDELQVGQDDLARAVSASRQTINYIENGTKTPNLTLAFEIAKALKISVSDLFLHVPIIADILSSWDREKLRAVWVEVGLKTEVIPLEGPINWDSLETMSVEEAKRIAQKLGQDPEAIFEFNFEEKRNL